MDEMVTIRLGGHSKITSMHTYLNRYAKLGYVEVKAEPVKRRRRPATPEAEATTEVSE